MGKRVNAQKGAIRPKSEDRRDAKRAAPPVLLLLAAHPCCIRQITKTCPSWFTSHPTLAPTTKESFERVSVHGDVLRYLYRGYETTLLVLTRFSHEKGGPLHYITGACTGEVNAVSISSPRVPSQSAPVYPVAPHAGKMTWAAGRVY